MAVMEVKCYIDSDHGKKNYLKFYNKKNTCKIRDQSNIKMFCKLQALFPK